MAGFYIVFLLVIVSQGGYAQPLPPSPPSPPCGAITCSDIHDPVCGSDGKTYGSACHLDATAACNPEMYLYVNCTMGCDACYRGCTDIACSAVYNPVCGSDGQSYLNLCKFEVAQCGNPRLYLKCNASCEACSGGCTGLVVCPAVYEPVCGSNGQTYGNLCTFRNAQCSNPSLYIKCNTSCDACSGGCTGQVACPAVYEPVCGSNGQTYSNLCTFLNAQCSNPSLYIRCNSSCNGDRPCPEIYSPVCGSDGRTYDNDCLLQNAICSYPSLYKVGYGACGGDPCEHPCPDIYAPVCGSDGKNYSNHCEFQIAQCKYPYLTMAHEGACCDWLCTKEYRPVCASDGITYDNVCFFQLAACKDGSLYIVSDGSCGTHCVKPCPTIHDPVCGSDGVTYSNNCELNNAQCSYPSLYQVGHGACGGDPCAHPCPEAYVYIPVCGSDGKNYSSYCKFQNAQCIYPYLTMAHEGLCCDWFCTKEYQPICASDGITYDNMCFFQLAACKHPGLDKLYYGECAHGLSDCDHHCPVKHYDTTVCDTRGHEHESHCKFAITSCRLWFTHGQKLTIKQYHPCSHNAGERAAFSVMASFLALVGYFISTRI